MNLDQERQLEAAVTKALKGLPDLPAPRNVLPNVMAAIQKRAALAWYRQPWQMWSLPLRAASMAVLVLAFGSLLFGTWQLTQLEGVNELAEEMARLKSWFAAMAHVVGVLGDAVVLVVGKLGKGIVIGGIVATCAAYAACVSLGTLWVRLAWARGGR